MSAVALLNTQPPAVQLLFLLLLLFAKLHDLSDDAKPSVFTWPHMHVLVVVLAWATVFPRWHAFHHPLDQQSLQSHHQLCHSVHTVGKFHFSSRSPLRATTQMPRTQQFIVHVAATYLPQKSRSRGTSFIAAARRGK